MLFDLNCYKHENTWSTLKVPASILTALLTRSVSQNALNITGNDSINY